MKHNGFARIISVIIVVMMLWSVGYAQPALIKTSTSAWSEPSASSKALGSISAGSVVKLVSQEDGWAKISKNDQSAYVRSGDVAKVTKYNGETVYMKSAGKLLKTANGNKSVKSLKKGQSVKIHATACGWAYITAGGKKGYVKTSSLTKDAPAGKTAYAKKSGVKVYKKASTSAKVLKKLSVNTELTIMAVKSGWAKVTISGKTGYVRKNQLSATKVDPVIKKKCKVYVVNDDSKVYKKNSTSSKVLGELDIGTKLTALAYDSTWVKVKSSKKTAYMRRSDLSSQKPKTPDDDKEEPVKGTAKEMDWWTSGIQGIFAKGTIATITDVDTGISWQEKRMGGTNHADCQPVTAADTAAMKKACGSWSWDRRAIFVTIDGVNYAASMNCQPHGSDSVAGNDFNGHHCIHFTNSRTHGTNKVCPLHQKAIKKASEARL